MGKSYYKQPDQQDPIYTMVDVACKLRSCSDAETYA